MKNLDKLREEFENIPEIQREIRIGDVKYVDVHGGIYGTNNTDKVSHNSSCFVSGAWFILKRLNK